MFENSKLYAGKNLSEVVSAIGQEFNDMQFGFEEMKAYGAPSECGGIIVEGTVKSIVKIIDESGSTMWDILRDVEYRTSYRFIYFNTCLFGVLDLLEECGRFDELIGERVPKDPSKVLELINGDTYWLGATTAKFNESEDSFDLGNCFIAKSITWFGHL